MNFKDHGNLQPLKLAGYHRPKPRGWALPLRAGLWKKLPIWQRRPQAHRKFEPPKWIKEMGCFTKQHREIRR